MRVLAVTGELNVPTVFVAFVSLPAQVTGSRVDRRPPDGVKLRCGVEGSAPA
jgi:hypothetical protein